MAYTQPAIGSITLPHVSGCSQEKEHRGAMVEMADGSVAFDVVATDKSTWTLQWQALTDSDKAIVESVWTALVTASASMTTPEGGTITVTRSDRAPRFKPQRAASGLRWDVELEFREV